MDKILPLFKCGVSFPPITADCENFAAGFFDSDNIGEFDTIGVFKTRKIKINTHLKDCVPGIVCEGWGFALYLVILLLKARVVWRRNGNINVPVKTTHL